MNSSIVLNMENNSNNLYLVTGAAGFLGSNVCRQLLDRGDKVRALVLPGDKAARYIPKDVEIVYGDLCDKQSLEPFFAVGDGTETICIHVASMVTVNPDFSQKMVDINVGGTKHIIEMCLAHKECRKLVYVGSTGAIPELPKGERIREIGRFDTDHVIGWYSKSKALATQAVLDAVRYDGLQACMVFPTGILGPNDFSVSTTTGTVIKIINGEMPVGMKGSFNLVDVRDLADGTIRAADYGRVGEGYILGNESVTLKDLSDILHEVLGCKRIRFYLPLWVAKMMAASAERKAKKTGEKPMMTTFSVYNLERNNCFDYSKAQKELGYHTRPFAETLADEARWLRDNGLVSA